MSDMIPERRPEAATVELEGLLTLVSISGAVLSEITLAELEAINAIRELVNDTAEVHMTYTGS